MEPYQRLQFWCASLLICAVIARLVHWSARSLSATRSGGQVATRIQAVHLCNRAAWRSLLALSYDRPSLADVDFEYHSLWAVLQRHLRSPTASVIQAAQISRWLSFDNRASRRQFRISRYDCLATIRLALSTISLSSEFYLPQSKRVFGVSQAFQPGIR